jgi:hypothetical protein
VRGDDSARLLDCGPVGPAAKLLHLRRSNSNLIQIQWLQSAGSCSSLFPCSCFQFQGPGLPPASLSSARKRPRATATRLGPPLLADSRWRSGSRSDPISHTSCAFFVLRTQTLLTPGGPKPAPCWLEEPACRVRGRTPARYKSTRSVSSPLPPAPTPTPTPTAAPTTRHQPRFPPNQSHHQTKTQTALLLQSPTSPEASPAGAAPTVRHSRPPPAPSPCVVSSWARRIASSAVSDLRSGPYQMTRSRVSMGALPCFFKSPVARF